MWGTYAISAAFIWLVCTTASQTRQCVSVYVCMPVLQNFFSTYFFPLFRLSPAMNLPFSIYLLLSVEAHHPRSTTPHLTVSLTLITPFQVRVFWFWLNCHNAISVSQLVCLCCKERAWVLKCGIHNNSESLSYFLS